MHNSGFSIRGVEPEPSNSGLSVSPGANEGAPNSGLTTPAPRTVQAQRPAPSAAAPKPKRRKSSWPLSNVSPLLWHLAGGVAGTGYITSNKLWAVSQPDYHMPIIPIFVGSMLATSLACAAGTTVKERFIKNTDEPKEGNAWQRSFFFFAGFLISLLASGVLSESTPVSPEEYRKAPIKMGITASNHKAAPLPARFNV